MNGKERKHKSKSGKAYSYAKTPASAVKPALHLLQIQEVHLVPHCNFCSFYPFSYLSYLGHTSLIGLEPEKDQKIAILLLSYPSSPVTRRNPCALR